MEFRISETFTSSLAKLSNDEQKAVKTTAFDLQVSLASPGMQFHRIENAKDSNFWSIRVTRDIRLIVHKTDASILLCYVDHHDDAYKWAQCRKIEQHPKTGAAQLVEFKESVREIIVPSYVQDTTSNILPEKMIFSDFSDEYLLGFGVPTEWINEVKVATEDSLFRLSNHLPQEATEALLELATGGTPKPPKPEFTLNPFDHPDAKRRFSLVGTSEELERALNYPWEKWTIFLHPDQRDMVTKTFGGPARVSGSAGTGKTIVALHRAVHLAKSNVESRVLLTTFSQTLANALRSRLKRLLENEPAIGERLEVQSTDGVALNLYRKNGGNLKIVKDFEIKSIISETAQAESDCSFSDSFLLSEWENVIDAWEIKTWDDYKKVKRLGRKKKLTEAQRSSIWRIFEKVSAALILNGLITKSGMLSFVSSKLKGYKNPPFSYIVIDEAQDISVSQLRFLSALTGNKADGLFFAGDLGQRIFQQPFSWKSLGVDVRGRSSTLKINYRTSQQIRSSADLLLPSSIADVDGNIESRLSTHSVFEGVPPEIHIFKSSNREVEYISENILEIISTGIPPHEIGVFVRSQNEIQRAIASIEKSGQDYVVLDENVETVEGKISISPMHLAKGLEFKVVYVMACDDEILPLQSRLETAADESDLEEVYQSERHLLYVACTRARDRLMVSGVAPASEFLEDMS